ncbi:MAG: glycosyl hydrolase [Bacteroidetes bacterium]|nr:MAG: glycosyl hydrolase [Bacteroidota bacterium]
MTLQRLTIWLLALLLMPALPAQRRGKPQPAETENEEKPLFGSSVLGGLSFRSVGPALTSGRIADLAVNPHDPAEYYVAVASGGVWKTVNAGTTYEPIFDSQGSYSIGCITLDPSNPATVWVGTGENNGQRSVAYGDGIYRSTDGGATWEHMGLKESEHIGKIIVHPDDPNTVWVAAQGPLWSDGGDRGLYKTTDGGKTWRKVLEVDEYTGANDIVIDPRNPDILYASTWQRARKVWTFIGGGPGSGLYRSVDGGETWQKSQQGLPGGDLGRIGLAISPVDPDVVYAIAEAEGDKGGFYRSTDRGASWQKRNDLTTSGNYYQEIVCDPHNVDRVYVMDTYAHVTSDGGQTFSRLGERHKHVDNHAMWIDPRDPDHYLMGCDGGLYETWDAAATWQFKPNLPVTQFYKVATDQATPFYNIYGGTQDNFSLGGPSRTINQQGITNSDWYATNGGDGFESQVDPEDPNIVYAQAQYGYLVRYDRRSGENISIQPQPGEGEPGLRWNWDAPLLISPHKATRLYFAANKLFRSEDRGNNWTAISPDLSRQLDRNTLPVMGRVWGMDAVAKNRSTSIYGNIVALDESPLQEGLLYVGTDDGLVQISDNGGESWQRLESFPGVPDRTYVNMLKASQHDANTVYAIFNNHKNGDFKPYILRSTDRGQTWTSIAADLPERGSVYCMAEDHVDPKLLFVGTEFGVFVSIDGGENWEQMKAGLPTIAVRDMEIQKRENDLVLATFGRGFYVLDDYSPLRHMQEETLSQEAHIFPVKDAWMFIEASPLVYGGKGFQGESYFTTDNPPVGAVFTYYLKEAPKTLAAQRKEREKELVKAGEAVPYPTFEEMRNEDDEEAPYLLFTITDEAGAVVTRIKESASSGTHRAVWNFRYPSTAPVRLGSNLIDGENRGYMAMPGTYQVAMSLVHNGELKVLTEPISFTIKLLGNSSLPAEDRKAVDAFMSEVAALTRDMTAASRLHDELTDKIKHIKAAIQQAPAAPIALLPQAREVETRLIDMERELEGDRSLSSREFETPPSLSDRLGIVTWGLWESTSAPTGTMKEAFQIAQRQFESLKTDLVDLAGEVEKLEQELERSGAPYTPGRRPGWFTE